MKKHNCFNVSKIAIGLSAALCATNALAYDPVVSVEQVTGGEVRFYDWGYHGPGDRRANDFSSINGFNGASQIQHVVTTYPDRITPDAPAQVETEFDIIPLFRDANMDGQVNFYKWGYTTVDGSKFNNMQIDADGDYLVPRYDMTFAYYGLFDYQYEGAGDPTTLPYNAVEGIAATKIGFQPYALTDATGWCGSVMVSNPTALEGMSGQVKFDFAFEAFLPFTPKGDDGVWQPGEGEMQIVQNFAMRSYGSLEVNITMADGTNLVFNADAVVNNTNPGADPTTLVDGTGAPILIEVPLLNMDGTPALDGTGVARTMMLPQKEVGGAGVDEAYLNKVSFMGGGVVPNGVWVNVVDPAAPMTNENIIEVLNADDGAVNTIWWKNSFSGYPFLLRADGVRVINAFDFNLYSDLSNVPASAFNANGELINLDGNVVRDLSVTGVNPVDPDGDNIEDWNDNCRDISNPAQQDTDGDNYGNACDADFNNDNVVNSLDIGLFKQMFLSTGDVEADLNGDGIVNSLDTGLFKARFLQPVGPSGTVK